MKRLLLSIGIVTAVLSVLLILRTRNRIEILATDDGMIVSAGAFSEAREIIRLVDYLDIEAFGPNLNMQNV